MSGGRSVTYSLPEDIEVDLEVSMYQAVAHADDV
jgi:hypothetical protein